MITVLTRVKIQDYAKWRLVFDETKSLRQAHSEATERVYRNNANPTEAITLVDFADEASAHAFFASSELRNAMQKAGVVPPPEVLFLEQAPDVAELDANTKVVKNVTEAIEAQNWNGALALLAPNFTFSGATPNPISAEQWIGIHKALAAAMPDLRMNYAPTKSNGTHTSGTVKITGTHKGEFVPPLPGIPRVPATGKALANPTEHVNVTVENGKLTEWQVEHLANGGVVGLLLQMGVALPNG